MRNIRRGHFGWATTLGIMWTVGLWAPAVHAQCAFDKPTATNAWPRTTVLSLVQGFVNCGGIGGNLPNTTALGSIPACTPPETYNTQAGSPPNGWRFSQAPNASRGRIRLDRANNSSGVPDLRFRAQLVGIRDASGPASGVGVVNIVLRTTFDDPVNGDMTMVDFTYAHPITVTAGNGAYNTTLDVMLAALTLPSIANTTTNCASHEIVSVQVLDPNGTLFAVPGLRIP